MTILDNYMFRPLLAIFRLSSTELKVLLYNVRARDGEISTSGFPKFEPVTFIRSMVLHSWPKRRVPSYLELGKALF